MTNLRNRERMAACSHSSQETFEAPHATALRVNRPSIDKALSKYILHIDTCSVLIGLQFTFFLHVYIRISPIQSV